MELENKNYFSKEARAIYMGCSEFKEFMKCESCALAKSRGEYEEPKSKALIMGSYIDAYFSNEMDEFKEQYSADMFTKQGVLKSEFAQCDDIIKFIEKDEKFLKYLSGEHQVVMTGEIAGVPFKIKIDSYFPEKLIVDQKVMKDMQPIWDDEKHCKVNFVEYYGYNIQGAIYQEIVRQNTGLKLPFVLAVATKEAVPEKALLSIDQEDLDLALALVEEHAPRFYQIKQGLIEPNKCGHCDHCKENAMVTGIFSYHTKDAE